jgi:hypothetical protein
LRPTAILARALLAFAALTALGAPRASAAQDGIARAAQVRLAKLRSSLRTDRGIYEKTAIRLAADLRGARVGEEDAATGHASALAFLLEKVDRATDEAAGGFLLDVSKEMHAPVTYGANPGDGGSLDQFTESVRAELSRLRGRVMVRARSFTKSFTHYGRGTTAMNALVPPWTFELPGVPTPGGVVSSLDEPPRLRLMCAARLADGRLLVTAAGTADRNYGGAFDLRLRSSEQEVVIPPALSAGGIQMNSTGAWTRAVELGDPFHGDVPLQGNRVLHFGIEPFDAGLAGIQPARLVHAGVFLIP